MLYVTTQPEALSATAATLSGAGATMSAQNSAAAAPTTGVLPAAADQVSALAAPNSPFTQRCIRRSAPRPRRFTSNWSAHCDTNGLSYAAAEVTNAIAAR